MTLPTPRVPVDIATWRARVSRSFVRLDVESLTSAARFAGHISGAERGRVRADHIDVNGEPHVVRRSRAAARSDGGQLLVSVQQSGTCLVRQAGREAVLGPSDLALYDSGRPYELVFPQGDHSQCVLQIPRQLLSLPALEDHIAIRVPGDWGLGGAVSSLLSALPRALPGTEKVGGAQLVRTGLDLLAWALAPHEEPEVRSQYLLTIARDFIQEHADDPALDPGAIAAGIHVSVGHLHRLFRSTGTSVNRFLIDLRVERSAQDLGDPRLRRSTITQIAHRRGFKDPAHFTRAFAARHGMSPSAWRAAQLGEA